MVQAEVVMVEVSVRFAARPVGILAKGAIILSMTLSGGEFLLVEN